jgi:hypothetical protein
MVETDVWCDVPNHDMYVRNLNNIGSAIEANNLETVVRKILVKTM